jgi:hypothetical protein
MGIPQKLIEQFASGTHERTPLQILIPTRGFADKHDARMRIPFAKHRIGSAFAQTASMACRHLLGKLVKGNRFDLHGAA